VSCKQPQKCESSKWEIHHDIGPSPLVQLEQQLLAKYFFFFFFFFFSSFFFFFFFLDGSTVQCRPLPP
jgi:hypothetical protein